MTDNRPRQWTYEAVRRRQASNANRRREFHRIARPIALALAFGAIGSALGRVMQAGDTQAILSLIVACLLLLYLSFGLIRR